MMERFFQGNLVELIKGCGDAGVFCAMFLESSIVPIPSELIIIGAGAVGISMTSILVFGSVGATLGAAVGYALGKYAGLPLILKIGRFILIKPHHLDKAQAVAKKYGPWSIFIGRLLPVVPFKVFSIAAGMTRVPFIVFMACTMAGVLPRIYLLTLFGYCLLEYKKPVLLALVLCLLVFFALKTILARHKQRPRSSP